MSASAPQRKKVVIVGDGACGKTCLLVSYIDGEMPSSYVPTVFETHVTDVAVDGNHYELSLWDTAGQDAYDRLRPLSYPDTDVMLVCFSVDQPDSLQNTHDKWVPEVRHFCPNIPVVMVCMKVDLRHDDDVVYRLSRVRQTPVTTQQGIDMARKLRAAAYVECSSVTRQGVNEVFDVAVRASHHLVRERASKKMKKMKKLSCLFL